MVEEYDDGNGSRGIIVRIGGEESNALIEISEIKNHHDYFQESFNEGFKNNKARIQIKTNDVFHWSKILKEKWEIRDPILRP